MHSLQGPVISFFKPNNGSWKITRATRWNTSEYEPFQNVWLKEIVMYGGLTAKF